MEKRENVQVSSVSWESEDDPENPLNWSPRTKWTNLTVIAIQGTLIPITSTILAPGALIVARDLHVSNEYILTLPVALFGLGLGLGALITSPLSEIFGRRIVYLTAFSIFGILNVGCALAPTIAALSVLRLLAGLAGAAGPALGGGTIGDMFSRHERGAAQAMYGFGPTIGPGVGAVMGAFIVAGTNGWRWTLWVMAIASGAVMVMSFFCIKETYAPFLLHQKAKRLRKQTGDFTLQAAVRLDPRKIFHIAITRPLRLLIFSPVCVVMSLYMAVIFGEIYTCILITPLLYGPVSVFGLFSYHWKGGRVGLAYIPSIIGALLATVVCATTFNRVYSYMARRDRRRHDQDPNKKFPEYRLPMMQLGKLFVPIGLFMLAWTAEAQPMPWIVPLLGGAIFSFGMLIAWVCIQSYLVDSFGIYAASALAAAILLRSIVGCLLTIFGVKLFTSLGYGWGGSTLGFISVAFTPVPLLLYIWRPKMQADSLFE